jgi:hypothetical protein
MPSLVLYLYSISLVISYCDYAKADGITVEEYQFQWQTYI